jgi:plasmid stabilization system protein ParE
MKIKISAGAERDIADGCDFYRDIDPSLAMHFYDSLSADIDSLILHAGVHAQMDGWHYTFATRFPFVIWYGVKGDLIIVYAVLDGRRDPSHHERALRNRRREVD